MSAKIKIKKSVNKKKQKKNNTPPNPTALNNAPNILLIFQTVRFKKKGKMKKLVQNSRTKKKSRNFPNLERISRPETRLVFSDI